MWFDHSRVHLLVMALNRPKAAAPTTSKTLAHTERRFSQHWMSRKQSTSSLVGVPNFKRLEIRIILEAELQDAKDFKTSLLLK
jgi:hypothetical protein